MLKTPLEGHFLVSQSASPQDPTQNGACRRHHRRSDDLRWHRTRSQLSGPPDGHEVDGFVVGDIGLACHDRPGGGEAGPRRRTPVCAFRRSPCRVIAFIEDFGRLPPRATPITAGAGFGREDSPVPPRLEARGERASGGGEAIEGSVCSGSGSGGAGHAEPQRRSCHCQAADASRDDGEAFGSGRATEPADQRARVADDQHARSSIRGGANVDRRESSERIRRVVVVGDERLAGQDERRRTGLHPV